MIIGIDIDGVLTDLETYQLEEGLKWIKETGIGKLVNPEAYETYDIFSWTLKQDKLFWDKRIWKYATDPKARDNASCVLKKLKEEGNTLYIITARTYTAQNSENGKKLRKAVKPWLKKNELYV